MKKIFVVILILLFSNSICDAKYVRGYYRKDGTYVQPHYRASRSLYPNLNTTLYSQRGHKSTYKPYSSYNQRRHKSRSRRRYY